MAGEEECLRPNIIPKTRLSYGLHSTGLSAMNTTNKGAR